MDIDELLIILEKNRNRLTKLEDDFYEKIQEKISELENLRKEADDYEISRIDDNIRTIRRIHRKIFETRTSKIIRAAWAAVCGEGGSVENLTSVERNLYAKLVETLSDYRDAVISGMKKAVDEKHIEKDLPEYVLVRVKTDIEEFEGIDGKTYKLSREEVVTLPKLNAKALIKADAVEPIEIIEVNRE
jgi:DNA replication factor GINS